jgi:indolepyruvate ferredoxin oxidoreductase alpha subunit
MKGRAAVFTGDIGCYTLGNAMPLDMVDTCLCMGAGLTQAQGIAEVSAAGTAHFAFIGDSTFMHSGAGGVINAVYNGHDIVVCVLDNSTTAMTGGQPHPGTGRRLDGSAAKRVDIAGLCRAAGADSVRTVNAFDTTACKEAATAAADEGGVRVIIFEGPCINDVPKGRALAVTEGCTGCGLCVSALGCPALSMKESVAAGARRRAAIDPVLCTGCGICTGVCPVGAIAGQPERGGDRP